MAQARRLSRRSPSRRPIFGSRGAVWLVLALGLAGVVAFAVLGTHSASPAASPSQGATFQGATTAISSAAASRIVTPPPTPSGSQRDPQPWLAWRPSGLGKGATFSLPAPWKSGTKTAEIGIYTPPGYSPKGTRRYPVLYEAPYPYSHWDTEASITGTMNQLIDHGTIPPVIVVAMSEVGDPFPDSECANSVDGREWFDTYVAQTVEPWVDAHYLTIATPQARAITGASQGGYCAAILSLHHPDVFGSSLVFSGYFDAGAAGGSSAAPFARDSSAIALASPSVVAQQLGQEARANLYFVLVALPSQPLYGDQATKFDQELTQLGYPHTLVASAYPHGWTQMQHEFPHAVSLWAARMVSTGVFDG